MIPSPAELTYFLEVAATLNLSRASERLGISQPSLSLAMKRLEETIGTDILIRHKQGVTLTHAGKQLLAHTKQLLQYWESTKTRALASHEEVRGCFTLGCHSTLAIHSLSGLLPVLLEKNPALEIKLKHDISRKIVEEVMKLSIDLGIVANPMKHPDLVIRKLCDDEVTFWVGPGKRDIQDIHSKKAVIICDPELSQTQALFKQCKKKGIHFDRILSTNSLEVVASLTASGTGIGILPQKAAKAMYPDKLKRLYKSPVFKDELCLVFRNENRNLRAMVEMIHVIKVYFEENKLYQRFDP
jgi:DNA-binding transcriptional LysR family regulator